MMMKLTREEMLAEWRRRQGMTPVSTSSLQLSRSDADSVDRMLLMQIDDWYSRTLANADPLLLPQRDLKEGVELAQCDDGSVEMTLPDECAQLLQVQLRGWQRPATVVADGSLAARMQMSRYVCGKRAAPVAVRCGRRLKLCSLAGPCELLRLWCVAPPPDGTYEFDGILLPKP